MGIFGLMACLRPVKLVDDSYETSRDVSASAEQVWGLIGSFQNLTWHPAVAKSELEGDNTPDNTLNTVRKLTFTDGKGLREELLAYDGDNKTYTYSILGEDAGFVGYKATISVSGADNGSKLSWNATWQTGKEFVPRQKQMIEGVFNSGCDTVVSHFKQ